MLVDTSLSTGVFESPQGRQSRKLLISSHLAIFYQKQLPNLLTDALTCPLKSVPFRVCTIRSF